MILQLGRERTFRRITIDGRAGQGYVTEAQRTPLVRSVYLHLPAERQPFYTGLRSPCLSSIILSSSK